MVESQINQPILLTRPIYSDSRGFFSEIFSTKLLNQLNFESNLQINFSKSGLGVTRGLHFQKEPHSQAKLITCLQGKILDVLLDLNSSPDDPTLHYFEMNAEDGEILFVPKGFAHAFQALVDGTEILYAVNQSYNSESEMVINVLDKDLDINWRFDPFLSDKDRIGVSFTKWAEVNRKAQ